MGSMSETSRALHPRASPPIINSPTLSSSPESCDSPPSSQRDLRPPSSSQRDLRPLSSSSPRFVLVDSPSINRHRSIPEPHHHYHHLKPTGSDLNSSCLQQQQHQPSPIENPRDIHLHFQDGAGRAESALDSHSFIGSVFSLMASDFGLLSVCLLCLWPTRSPMVSNDGEHEACNNNSKRCFWGCRYWTMGMGVQNGLLNDMKGEVDDFVLPRLSSGSVLIF